MRAVTGDLPLRVPALAVEAVHAPELQPAALDPVGERTDHPAVLPLEEAPHRAGEDDHARAVVPELQQVHVSTERRAVPAMVLAVHDVFGSMRYAETNQDFGNRYSSTCV